MYKIYPVTGLELVEPIEVIFDCLHEYDEVLPDIVVFFPVSRICEVEYISNEDAELLVKRFPQSSHFAYIRERRSSSVEVHFIRCCLGILFFERIFSDRFFSLYSSSLTWGDVKIGTEGIGANDFSVLIPKYYSRSSDAPSWKRESKYFSSPIVIDYKVQETLNRICAFIIDSQMSKKIMSAFNYIYYILPQTDLSINVLVISNILETLLITDKENDARKGDIKKKIAVRTAAIACANEKFNDRWQLAWYIKKFYELRSEITHEGRIMNEFEAFTGESLAFQYARTSIFIILKQFITKNIKNHGDMMVLVKNIIAEDGLDNGFDYFNIIDSKLIEKNSIFQSEFSTIQKQIFIYLANKLENSNRKYFYRFGKPKTVLVLSRSDSREPIASVSLIDKVSLSFSMGGNAHILESCSDITDEILEDVIML